MNEGADKSSTFQSVKGVLVGALIAVGSIYVLMVIGAPSRAPVRTSEVSTVPVGSEGRLNRGGPVVPVAIDEEVLSDLKRLAGGNDLNGIGPIFFVTDDTPIRVSESGVAGLRVKILAGSQKGRSGWVPLDWVKPLSNLN